MSNNNQTDIQHAKISGLNEFLWTCAGVNKAVLRKCPSDYAKYAGIGGTILFTALMAMLFLKTHTLRLHSVSSGAY